MWADVRDPLPGHESLIERLERDGWIGRVIVLAQCGSSNPLALEAWRAGVPTLVVTGSQTEGRGRRGARWMDEPGGSALCSFAWAPGSLAPADAGLLGILGGVAAAQTCIDLGVTRAQVKWPNDIWCKDRKLGGVLVETRLSSGGIDVAVLGVGVNLAAHPDGLGPDAVPATSLHAEGGHAEPLEFVGSLAARIGKLLLADGAPDVPALLEAYGPLDALKGRRVSVDDAERSERVSQASDSGLCPEPRRGVYPSRPHSCGRRPGAQGPRGDDHCRAERTPFGERHSDRWVDGKGLSRAALAMGLDDRGRLLVQVDGAIESVGPGATGVRVIQ